MSETITNNKILLDELTIQRFAKLAKINSPAKIPINESLCDPTLKEHDTIEFSAAKKDSFREQEEEIPIEEPVKEPTELNKQELIDNLVNAIADAIESSTGVSVEVETEPEPEPEPGIAAKEPEISTSEEEEEEEEEMELEEKKDLKLQEKCKKIKENFIKITKSDLRKIIREEIKKTRK